MDFSALKELVQTVTRNKIKNIEVLGNNPDQEGSLIEMLYDGIGKGEVNSEEEAVSLLYGDKESPKSAAYLRTRNRLIRQLINISLFVDISQPMFNDRAKAYYNCYRDFASAHILTLRDAIQAAIDIFEQTLEQAVKYEFVDLTADISRELRKLYGRASGDPVKHERISKIHREYEKKKHLEMLALEHYESLINYYIVKRSPSKEVHKLASQYFEELYPIAKEANTSQYYYYTYTIGLIRHFSANDTIGALKLVEEALEILKREKIPTEHHYLFWHFKR